jgi:hypothetical protein
VPDRDRETVSSSVNPVVDGAIYMLDPQRHVMTRNLGAKHIKDYASNEGAGYHFGAFPANSVFALESTRSPISMSMTDPLTVPYLRFNKNGGPAQASMHYDHRPLHEFASARQWVNRQIIIRFANASVETDHDSTETCQHELHHNE